MVYVKDRYHCESCLRKRYTPSRFHATVIDNQEKVNIVKRIILGAQKLGVDKIYFMPNSFNIGEKAVDTLQYSGELACEVEVLPMYVHASADDTTRAAKMMAEKNVGCIIVMGGDGTSRAVAKAKIDIPIISISTGTNNVYPDMIEELSREWPPLLLLPENLKRKNDR